MTARARRPQSSHTSPMVIRVTQFGRVDADPMDVHDMKPGVVFASWWADADIDSDEMIWLLRTSNGAVNLSDPSHGYISFDELLDSGRAVFTASAVLCLGDVHDSVKTVLEDCRI
jgi:hypothetical protein